MLRKLPIDSLRPGMYITNVVQSGLDCPVLFSADVMLECTADIDTLRSKGYTDALVDLDRSDEQWRRLYGGSEEAGLLRVLTNPPKPTALIPQVSLRDELPQAKQLYTRTLHTVQQVMEDFKKTGQADVEAGSNAVEGIVDSVSRNASALLALSKLRTKDNYTFSHCINVATEAVIFAKHLGYDGTELHTIGLAGFFHDLGKMEIPLEILNSPRRLSAAEFAVMREHPTIGYKHLNKIPDLSDLVIRGALEHHERINGKGYPDGKKGDEISLAGKILAVVDVYDALSSRRVYKDPMAPHSALGLIYGMRGEDFVPELVERFIQCVGIYPPGSLVQLTSEHLAVVSQVDPDEPLRPQLILVREADGRDLPPTLIDLKLQRSLQITQCLDPRKYNLNPLSVLEQHAK
jgi:HD-GYP domain-containing protein (c-di-GMP phosphodiesterase class II)